MKRTELRRKTPLARGTSQLRRTPIRRKPRPESDKMTGDVHRHIINRDRMCIGILLRQLFPEMGVPWHQCRNTYGDPHEPTDLLQLTVDHFHHHAGGTKGKRAESDPEHGTAACGDLNGNHMSALIRQGQRRYIEWLREQNRL